MFDYIVLPTCTFQEYNDLIMLKLLAQTPIQEGYCRVRLSGEILSSPNVIPSTDNYKLSSGDYLGVFA